MKKLVSFFCAALFACGVFASDGAAAKPERLTAGEFFENPIGYNLDKLSFSWRLPEGAENAKQTAYRIAAGKTPDVFSSIVWDSGKVFSDQSVHVPYGGKALDSRERIYWRVRFWNADGKASAWSDVAFAEAGLLRNSDWQGKWIFSPEPRVRFDRKLDRPSFKQIVSNDHVPPAYFRRETELGGKIESARLYVASRGVFRFFVNGKRVGNDCFGTGWTDYNVRIQTNTYDITKMLLSGKNTFAAILGDGWFSGRLGWKNTKRGFYGERPELLAQIEITFRDGSKKIVATDSSWKYSYGAVRFSDIYDGEIYDARLEMDGWNANGFDDSQWKTPAEKNVEPKPLLEPRRSRMATVGDELTPLSVRKIARGTYIFDLGQNMAGWARIKIPAQRNKTVKLRFAEMLNQDGTMYTDNYRSAVSEDIYTSAGGVRPDEWEPMFTYHGFRYVEISGLPDNIEAQPDWVKGIVIYNDMPQTGSFVCSNSKINRLQSCIQWSQRGNFLSVPTDCPQRDERLGWLCDAQVFTPTAAFNMDISAFYSKWLRDIADTAYLNGAPAGTAPDYYPATVGPVKNAGIAAWADAIAVCPWEIYKAYGGRKILEENYDYIKSWVEYQKRTSKNLVRPALGYGDWLQPNGKKDCSASDAPKDLIGTAYFAHTAELASKTALVLGKDGDAKQLVALASDVRAAFMKAYVSPDGTVKSDCQTAYLLTLGFDIAPENMRTKIFEKFLSALKRDGYRISSGIVGIPHLLPVLTRFGRVDLAYKILLNESFPSWLYMVDNGATTLWERWNSYSPESGFGDTGMNSFNHICHGVVGQWLYKDVAGIWHDESGAGYKNIVFAPKIGGGLTFAAASHETPYGYASASWKISDGVMEWTVVIPQNATGTVVFPTKNLGSIRVNGKPLPESAFSFEDGYPALKNVSGGTHRILLRPQIVK